jgi:squalene-hopene/tetraprenyl-beta-curcumene cyclase
LVTTALLRHGKSPDGPLVSKSLKYLKSFIQPSGGIHGRDSLYRNYETCLAILCLTEANRDGKYDAVLAGAERFVKDMQWDEGEGKDPTGNGYGGAGYGKHGRPDLSNS